MRTRITAVAGLVALTALSACGDDGGPSGSAPSDAPSSSAAAAGAPVTLKGTVTDKGTKDLTGATELELELDDSYFSPTFIQGKPGSTIAVELENEGTMPHTFTIDAAKVDVTVEAGKKGTASVTLPASGALAFYCKFHVSQGMQGAFYDKPGATAAGGSGDGGAYGQ